MNKSSWLLSIHSFNDIVEKITNDFWYKPMSRDTIDIITTSFLYWCKQFIDYSEVFETHYANNDYQEYTYVFMPMLEQEPKIKVVWHYCQKYQSLNIVINEVKG